MHISFDFDYTLADSSDGSVECANYALREMGLAERPSDIIKKTVGFSLEKTFSELNGSASADAAAAFKRLYLQRADAVILSYIQLYNGVAELLAALRADGHHLSIVSTKYRSRIEQTLARDGLSGLVDQVIGGDDVNQNKPDPEGLLLAIEHSGISSEHCIYVGDSVSDGECAQRAGVRFLAVRSGTTEDVALARWQPVAMLDSVCDLNGDLLLRDR